MNSARKTTRTQRKKLSPFIVSIVLAELFLLFSCQKQDLELDNEYFAQRDVNTQIKTNVPLQGFYKDIFMDAGVYLTTRNSLAAATHLGFSLESVSCTEVADTLWQNTVIGGDENDLNGRLLYPDGQPRYKMIFVCGGNSRNHGQSLRPSCLERMRNFVINGGSYVGVCAGAFFATCGYDAVVDYPYYLHLWPSTMRHTGLSNIYTGLFVDQGSSLLNYYDFGGDNYVDHVYHNGGGYPSTWPNGTELLARYDYPNKPSVHGKPVAWAYKNDRWSGKVIMIGSHPEAVTYGERLDLTSALLQYATDKVGYTKIKGILSNGEPWVMDKSSTDNDPEHTMIGDLQYHHFVVNIPEEANDITFTLSSTADCDLQLSVCSNTYAYDDKANYIASVPGANQQLHFDHLSKGLWYVAVRCLTTVISTDIRLGQEYSGRIDVLNGMPYTIQVTWEDRLSALENR